MSSFRRVTDQLSVSPQIALDDVRAAADQGFVLIVSNRPDGEDVGQPTAAQVAAAAADAGLAFAHLPVRGGPTPDQVDQLRELTAKAGGPALLFCRTGTRSIVTWALGQALSGARSRQELLDLGAQAGYDLSAVLPR